MKKILSIFCLCCLVLTIDGWAQTAESDGFDGRFGLGVNGKQILYGYPNAQPTSYFLVRVKNPKGGYRYATNMQRSRERVFLLKSKAEQVIQAGVLIQENHFQFSAIKITEQIIPLNSLGQAALQGEQVRSFKVEYMVQNNSPMNFELGFAQFLDFKLDDNDACRMTYNQKQVSNASSFAPNGANYNITLFQDETNPAALTAILSGVATPSRGTNPDSIICGDYRDLNDQLWDWELKQKDYRDAAVVLQWNDAWIKANESKVFSFVIGVADHYSGQLAQDLDQQTANVVNESVYFDLGSSKLTATQINQLTTLLSGKDISKIVLAGFSDQVGSPEQCLRISQERVQQVEQALLEIGIDKNILESTAYGSTRAGALVGSELSSGKRKDRRVDILLILNE